MAEETAQPRAEAATTASKERAPPAGAGKAWAALPGASGAAGVRGMGGGLAIMFSTGYAKKVVVAE